MNGMSRAQIIEAGVIYSVVYYAQLEHGHETMSFFGLFSWPIFARLYINVVWNIHI